MQLSRYGGANPGDRILLGLRPDKEVSGRSGDAPLVRFKKFTFLRSLFSLERR